MDFKHKSVLLDEVIENLNIKPDGTYIDGTIGGAGHSLEILKRLDSGMLIGVDQDLDALEVCRERTREYKDKVLLFHNNYSQIDEIVCENSIERVDGILLDLGVSSYQLDNYERGFSHNNDARLDMRMNQESGSSAWNVVNEYSEKELSNIIYKYGEEKWASRIAKFIVEERKTKPIDTTLELVTVIKKAIPKSARKEGHHPAKKTFQAIRIEVNDELNILENTIEKLVKTLSPEGRLAIITFHSMEDRIVKNAFKYLNLQCICPYWQPKCTCDKKREVVLINRKPIIASQKELEDNPRARSAKLRVIEKYREEI